MPAAGRQGNSPPGAAGWGCPTQGDCFLHPAGPDVLRYINFHWMREKRLYLFHCPSNSVYNLHWKKDKTNIKTEYYGHMRIKD